MNPLAIFDFGSNLLDKFFPDKDEAAKAKIKLIELQQNGELVKLQTQAGIITAESKSEHFIVSAWRPMTMLVFVFIIANNYILAPYAGLLFSVDISLEIPDDMWDLLKLGIGGYVGSRGVEKSIKEWKK